MQMSESLEILILNATIWMSHFYMVFKHQFEALIFMIFQMQDGVVIHDEEMSERWNQKYENGYKMTEGLIIHARKEP